MMRVFTGILITLTFVVVSAIGSPSFAQCTNMLANPGFEDTGGSYDGWFTFPGAPSAGPQIDTAISRSGAASAKIFGVGTGCPILNFDVSGFGQGFASPTAGDIYELSGYSYVSSGDAMFGADICGSNRLIAQIAFFSVPAGGSPIATNEVIIGNGTTIVDQWNPFTVSLPAPATAVRVEALFLFLQPGCDTGSVYVDDVVFCQTSPTSEPNQLVNPSFDTNLDGWTTFENAYYDGRSFARRTPTGAAKLYGPFTLAGAASGMYQSFPAVQGSEWTFEVYSMTTCGGDLDPITGTNENFGSAKITFKGGGAEIGAEEVIIMDNTAPLGTWTKHTVTAVAPAGTDTVSAYILFVQPDSTIGGKGSMFIDDASLRQGTATGVTEISTPHSFELHQNVPNPFNPSTRIAFDLTQAEDVDISVHDVTGKLIATLFDGTLGSGSHSVTWDGRATNGATVATGVYWYVMRTATGHQSRKMVLIK